MMGVSLDGPAHLRVDNMFVVHNTQSPEATLKKKSNAISYHFVCEAVASKIARVAYEESKSNLADLLTKIQTGLELQQLVSTILVKRLPANFFGTVVHPAALWNV
jgi:hypothetical protein